MVCALGLYADEAYLLECVLNPSGLSHIAVVTAVVLNAPPADMLDF